MDSSIKTAVHLDHAAELWSGDPTNPGPTGSHVEVLEGTVQDYGGNVLYGPAHPFACVKRANQFRLPFRLVPTKWRAVDGEVCGADHTWQLVAEPNRE